MIRLPTPQAGKDHGSYPIELSGSLYYITLYYNKRADGWHIDLADSTRVALLRGVRAVAGIDLLHPYRYRAVPPGILFIQVADKRDPDLRAFVEGRAQLYYHDADA